MTEPLIEDVSDTAFWVTLYRARETERPDALFRDPIARKLVGEREALIHKRMMDARYVEWSVVIRTRIIDDYIQMLIHDGIDTVVNLGAGLDTRPYRLELPSSLRWIEVDFEKIIALKNERLSSETPRCRLGRISLDLSNEAERDRLLSEIDAGCENALILTEGVTPYLSNADVGSLARSLRAREHFRHFITDYNSPELVRRLQHPRRRKQMNKAPFLFDPPDWTQFFADQGWKVRDLKYIGEQAVALGRPAPHAWWVKILMSALMPKAKRAEFRRMNGYALLEPS